MTFKSLSTLLGASALAIYAAGLLYEGFIADGYGGLLTLSLVDKMAAQRAYDGLSAGAPEAERASAAWRLARADPANPESWNALAYDDWLKNGRLTADGLRDLDHSYALTYLDGSGAVWRVGFALDHWSDLTPQLRLDVQAEALDALQQQDTNTALAERMRSVQDPAGRLASALIEAEAAKR
jgi:hypothetical protein